MGGRDSQGVWDEQIHTAVFKVDHQQGPAVSTGNSAQCYVVARMGAEFKGEWIYVYVWLSSLCRPTKTIITIVNQLYPNIK